MSSHNDLIQDRLNRASEAKIAMVEKIKLNEDTPEYRKSY